MFLRLCPSMRDDWDPIVNHLLLWVDELQLTAYSLLHVNVLHNMWGLALYSHEENSCMYMTASFHCEGMFGPTQLA